MYYDETMNNLQPGIQLVFGTPLWRLKWPDSLSESLARIGAQVEADIASGVINSGFNRSNFLGSQSRRCLLRESPYLQDVDRKIFLQMLSSVLPLEGNFLELLMFILPVRC